MEPFQDRIFYKYQKNSGSAIARNIGIKLANGEFLVFLDSDDLLLPGKFKEQTRILINKPSLGMIHSGWNTINEKDEIIEVIKPWEKAPILSVETRITELPVKLGALMFRKTWLNDGLKFDPEMRQSQDTDLLLQLALAGCTCLWLKKSTMSYRIHQKGTITINAYKQHFYVKKVLDKFFSDQRIPENILSMESEIRFYTNIWSTWHAFRYNQLDVINKSLNESFIYSPFSPMMTVLVWVNGFMRNCRGEVNLVKRLLYVLPDFFKSARINNKKINLLNVIINTYIKIRLYLGEKWSGRIIKLLNVFRPFNKK